MAKETIEFSISGGFEIEFTPPSIHGDRLELHSDSGFYDDLTGYITENLRREIELAVKGIVERKYRVKALIVSVDVE